MRGLVHQGPLRILLVTAPGPVGGLETVVVALADGLTRRGHQVTVSASVDTGNPARPFQDELLRRGIPVFRPPSGYLGEVRALRALAVDSRADVLHSHGYRSDVLVRIAAAGLDRALVSTAHGFTGGGFRNRLYEDFQRRILRGFGAVVAVSRLLKTRLNQSGISPSRLHVVPNANEPLHPPLPREAARARLGLSPSGAVIGWVGRLSREKGADVAIEALARLGDRDWTAVFVGDGPERGALQRTAERLGLAGRIRWPGVVAGAGALFSAFDVFLLSSRTEGTPIVLLEAAAAGVPIVATDVGGVADLLGEAGAPGLAPSEDPAALARLLAASLEQPDESRDRAGRLRTRLTGPAAAIAWIDRYEAIYRSLLGGPSLNPADS